MLMLPLSIMYMMMPISYVDNSSVATTVPLKIEITTQNPGVVTLTKAPLKYDKKHVLTMENDDALNDPYKTFLPLFTGGIPEHDNVSSTGMYITDGCGNDVSYKSNAAVWVKNPETNVDWFSWSDGTHWLNYDQLNSLMENKFGLVDHGYYTDMSHANADPVQAVENFVTWSESHYGFRPLYAVAPGGIVFNQVAWTNKWFSKGLRFIVLGSGSNPAMTRVDNLDVTKFTEPLQVGRNNVEGMTAESIMAYVNTMIASSGNQWLRLFGHNVNVADFIKYSDIKAFFTQLSTTYGKSGSDNIWVADINDVISYLYCRDGTALNTLTVNNKNIVQVEYSSVPTYVKKRSLTLKINTTETITKIKVTGATRYTYTNNLINIEW